MRRTTWRASCSPQVNPAFAAQWKAKTGAEVSIRQSHGGSSKQARSVAEGLQADVVTFNQVTDIEFLERTGLVAKGWQKRSPNDGSPLLFAAGVPRARGQSQERQGLGRSRETRRAGGVSESQDLRQRPLHLSRRLCIRARPLQQRRCEGARIRRQGARQRSRVRHRRAGGPRRLSSSAASAMCS